MSSHQFAYSQQRRSTRIEQAMPILVQGVGALREPYQEQVSTLSISCHGCAYQSKIEVIQGETVYLEFRPSHGASVGGSSRARVKWVQKLASKDHPFQVAVELEVAGNIWGITSPPDDWFPVRMPEANASANPGRELKLVSRNESQIAQAPEGAPGRVSLFEASDTADPPIPPLAQLMVGLGEQIQNMASEAAASALIKEKSRVLDEFRAQLRGETVKVIQSVVATSKDVITRHALTDLSEALEAGARNQYALWMKKIEQDTERAREHLLMQGTEVSQRIDGLAAGTIERVQHNMETVRADAAERFVARLRDQVAPMLAEARVSIQKLEASKTAFKKESESICAGLETQLELSTNASLVGAQAELEKTSTAVATRTNEALLKLYQGFEKAAQDNVESLVASLMSQTDKILAERMVEISREFSSGLEGYTRNYLESIGKSIAEISPNLPGRSNP